VDLNMDALRDRLGELPGIAQVVTTPRACTPEGWQEVQRVAKESKPNRVLIGACMPYAYVPKLRELGAMLRLNPAMMDVVDVVSPLVAPQRKQEEAVGMFQQVVSTLRMAAMKLLGADPAPLPQPRPVSKAALVVGGGLAGMTAAVGIADHGYHVTLVERSESLGGLAMHHKFSMGDGDPARYMEDLVDRVEHHPNITVHKDSRVALTMGRAGKFMSVVATPDGGAPLEHGATILATGGKISKVYGFGFLVRKTVFTQMELEQQLASGALDLEKIDAVAMIQCWRSGDQERTYCSRVCCANALKNVLALKAKRPDLPVYVFYRDMMSYGFQERFFTKARQAGAVFFRYDPETPPKVTFNESQPVITAHDPVLRQDVVVQADILALSCGVEPEEADEIAEIFGVPLDADGFYQEAERKWRPVDFLKQGVFHCGLGRAPGNMGEIVASSKAAAQRALCILSEQRLTADSIIAEVRHSLCSLCGRCVEVCPYGARSIDLDHDLVVVDELLCQGCGSCAAVCPNSASYLRGFRDKELMSTIDAALEDVL
jgi:heterodisulfide reductase subunit A